MSHSSRKVVALLIVVAFLALALGSFAAMTYGSDGRMEGNCPFSAMGASLCPQDALATVTHHISAYQSFLNAPAGFRIIAALIVALLFVFFGALVRMGSPHLRDVASIFRRFRPRRLLIPQNENTLRWLALFEHSPSF